MRPNRYHTVSHWMRLLQGESQAPRWSHWLIWSAVGLLIAKGIVLKGALVSIGIIGMVVALPIVVSALWNTSVGIYIMLLMAFFISIPNRLAEGIPMGVLIDLMILVMLVGLLYRCTFKRDWSVFSTPITTALLAWVGMNVFELINPMAASRQAWFFVIRPAVGYLMLFFLAYAALDTPKKMIRFLFVILALSMLSAIWGIWQANFGYFSWEFNYVLRHDLVHLVFNYGRWRAIGSIGSPAQFGILMAFISMISLSLIGAFRHFTARIFLGLTLVTSLLGMVYSGTRSAYVIIPAFYLVWVVLLRNRKMYLTLIVAGVAIVVLATMPTQNYHIQRIQSVFKASEDASYQTRARNKAIIFPWILKHPIGGGLGSTGVWGQRFSPGTFLANFPPDSGLIRVAVELGWVGLIIFLNVYFSVIVKGAVGLWKMNNRVYKAIVAGFLSAIIPLLVVEWGQEVVGVFPMSILFWFFLAILFRAIYFDRMEQQTHTATTI